MGEGTTVISSASRMAGGMLAVESVTILTLRVITSSEAGYFHTDRFLMQVEPSCVGTQSVNGLIGGGSGTCLVGSILWGLGSCHGVAGGLWLMRPGKQREAGLWPASLLVHLIRRTR